MDFSTDVLRHDEKVIFNLRTLYSSHGYVGFRMSHFEDYELYAANRAFLPDGDIVAFTDAGGKLMALRPDVTLSIVKSLRDGNELSKLYYNENIYRTVDGELKEQMQVGLECIGPVNTSLIGEVVMLAKQSLDVLGKKTRLDISHMGFLNTLIQSDKRAAVHRAEILLCLGEKNIPALQLVCKNHQISDDLCKRLVALASLSGSYPEVKDELRRICINDEAAAALGELDDLNNILKSLGITEDISIDFSVSGDITYYNGIIFQGFVDGIPSVVLSGGRYDELVRSFGKTGGAVGFAVYLDLISMQADTSADGAPSFASSDTNTKMLSIALPKGRLGDDAYSILRRAGYECPDMPESSRKLVLENPEQGIRYLWVKPSDVAIYVERGAADIGVIGKDTLLEGNYDVFELLDLGLGKCRMCVASKIGTDYNPHKKTLRVATKFPNIAHRHFTNRACNIDIIKLHGSIELAPLIGLSDVIVDLVQTGATLTENNMESAEVVAEISARLIANKASYRFNFDKISSLCNAVAERVSQR